MPTRITLLQGKLDLLILGLAGCRELKSLLFGLGPTDASTTVMAITGMIVVGLLAALIPARRASRIDPTQALRYE